MIKEKIKNFIARIITNSFNDRLIQEYKLKSTYRTYWDRPKKVDEINFYEESYSNANIGIVLQGQLMVEDHFTFETVKYYRRLYSHCPIIVSTWKNEDSQELKTIESVENVTIVLNDYPLVSGHGHINFQRKNSLEGIKMAEKLGCKYVLKTRTDQRMYASNAILFLKDLVETYPLRIKANAKGRIAVCSLSTLKDRIYNICDMLLFGYVEDMHKYFEPDEAPACPKGTIIPDEKLDPVGFAKFRPGEIYFATNYIENCGFELKWTFDDSDYYRNELFIVFDSESVDQFWPKYNRKEYMWRSYNTTEHNVVSFKEWFIHQNES